MGFKIPTVLCNLYSHHATCSFSLSAPALLLLSGSTTSFIQSTTSSIFPWHMKSLGYEDVLWMFTKYTCVFVLLKMPLLHTCNEKCTDLLLPLMLHSTCFKRIIITLSFTNYVSPTETHILDHQTLSKSHCFLDVQSN